MMNRNTQPYHHLLCSKSIKRFTATFMVTQEHDYTTMQICTHAYLRPVKEIRNIEVGDIVPGYHIWVHSSHEGAPTHEHLLLRLAANHLCKMSNYDREITYGWRGFE